MPATQADVAIRAGVSRKTVSNVVNRYPHVSKDVMRRVDAAIEELGYTPNHAARSLRTGRTRTIQLVIPELDVSYFAELARWVVAAAEDENLSVLIRQTLGDSDRERRAIEGELGDYADGTILSPVSSDLGSILSRKSTSPIVLVGELAGDGALLHIGIDNESAAFAATDFLVQQGRSRIAFIGAQREVTSHMAQMRRRGYERALGEAGLPHYETLVQYTDGYHRSDGATALRNLLKSNPPPDAVFCATDLLALGAMRAAHDLGFRIPDDLLVMGFDDIEESQYSIPSLSTVSPDKRTIAERAVSALVRAMDADVPGEGVAEDPIGEEIVSYTVMKRESTS